MPALKNLLKQLTCGAAAILGLSACADETASGYAEVGKSYWLKSINKVAFQDQASIRFDEGGTISGAAPCNSYGAGLLSPYPWFKLGPMRVTRALCDNMDAESKFFQALGKMTLIEVSGKVLLLTNEAGDEMLFKLADEG